MISLLLASVFVPLSHLSLSSAPLRAALVHQLGERYFAFTYSVVALIAFAWLITAYRHAPTFVLRTAPVWVKAVPWPVMLAASLWLMTQNPVIVGSDGLLGRPVRRVLRITRNPLFLGRWALFDRTCRHIGTRRRTARVRQRRPYPRASAGGVRKAPRQEIAGCGAGSLPRAMAI
jgi:hypothetical protein